MRSVVDRNVVMRRIPVLYMELRREFTPLGYDSDGGLIFPDVSKEYRIFLGPSTYEDKVITFLINVRKHQCSEAASRLRTDESSVTQR